MRRSYVVLTLCLLAVAGAWLFWPHGGVQTAGPGDGGVAATVAKISATNTATRTASKPATLNTNKLAFRVANTTNSIRQLQARPHAILLANAFIDTDKPLDLQIPAHLRAASDAGTYIVQARGAVDAHFRAALASAGAEIISYIPNNAYLVRLAADGAGALAGSPLVQAVLPYEPYYKVQSSLLGLAVNEKPLPSGMALNLGLFAADAATVEAQLEKLGAKIIARDRSAFGPVLRVQAPENWTALARVPGVQIVEPARARVPANDLSRVTVGISPDTTSGLSNSYAVKGQVLTGSNVLVELNDSGVDATHPDLQGRVFGDLPFDTDLTGRLFGDLVDTNGHGTHVAGIIASSGAHSLTPTDVGAFAEGSVSNADFRGKAPLASLYSVAAFDSAFGKIVSDQVLQEVPARTNALISNNSWTYGTAEYDLAAASYDAATRDALPFTPGSQPVLFVFAAGNIGGGDNDGTEGSADTILSPGTAKNVITVGAMEQLRNITNLVTKIANGNTNKSAVWQPETDSDNQVAAYSSRGNVGVGIESDNGRFKPDVVAPGTFVVSTRSSQWDKNAYYNPTNGVGTTYTDQIVDTNGLLYYNNGVPATPNAVSVVITISPNQYSPSPFPTNLMIYAKQGGFPTTTSYDILTVTNGLSIPPDSGGAISGIQAAQAGFTFAVGSTNSFPVNYDLTVQILTTNFEGDLESVLEGMNDLLGPFYRYEGGTRPGEETGTSMAAADVSGVLALIQDYFINQFAPPLTPSPALMKALLINGARSLAGNALATTNSVNSQGWGLANIQNCVPLGGLFNQPNGSTPGSSFFVEQNPTNALATGDSHTFIVTIDFRTYAQYLQLQATLVWTDPPGDPAAAIKLVNNLDLIITNLDTGDVNYGSVYVGNDISPDVGYNLPWATNGPPNLDSINNVENILLPQNLPLATKYSVTVVGRAVNVNAVTAQTNNAAGVYEPNVVQDYALVISVGEGEVTNAFTVTDGGIASNPTGDQNITVVTSTNSPLFNQIVGASSPLLGTNNVPLGTNTVWGPDGVVTIGQTNQWHFYIITNSGPQADYTNAAFITFDVTTLSVPRMGVYEDTVANATRPEADIDLYVTMDPSIMNLNPVAISNCLAGANNSRASLTQGGTEFAFFTNSAPGEVYYVGVKSEDRMGAEYALLPIFTDIPFSGLDQNGNQVVHGLLLPTDIPDGNPTHPGVTNVFALAIMPMVVEKVTVTNLDEHQNFGDLFGALTFSGQHVVLNNHDAFGNTYGRAAIVYDDSRNRALGTTNSDGPGSLVNFRQKSALGPWILGVQDNAPGHTGQVSRLDLVIQPHRDLKQPGIIVAVPPGGWFIDYVDVPPGYTNLTFYATNVTVPVATPPIQMYEKFGNDPTLTDYDQEADLTNGTPPGNSISIGPPLAQGQYFIGLYNPNTTVSQNVFISATLGINANANDIYDYSAASGQVLPDDAVSAAIPGGSVITVPNTVTQLVASLSVGLVVQSPRISDYTFTLVSPNGQRVLLMENRGAGDTNGAGTVFYYTNILNTTATGGAAANTNYLVVDPGGGTVPIIYNFYTVPDQMTVYDSTNPADFNPTGPYCILNTGFINNPPQIGGGAQNTQNETTNTSAYPPGTTLVTIIMNQFGNPYSSSGDAWWYSAGAAITNYEYLTFTDDTNLATVPIKFAETPFDVPAGTAFATNFGFEQATSGDYFAPTNIIDTFGGWTVPTNLVVVSTIETNGQFVLVTNVVLLTSNLVSVITDPSSSLTGDAGGSNLLALADGTITRTIPTVPGRIYNVTFWYRGPGIAGWWRGEGNASDSSDPENNNNNGTLVGQFTFPAGEVGQAFAFDNYGNPYEFAATNNYVQVPASASLNVGAGGGFTIEGWINPTNLARPQPLVEWLAHVPTNTAVTNVIVVQGPVLNPATGHYYYLLAATNWTTSETWAQKLGGHLATIETANEENWVYDTFTAYGTLNRDLWIGLTNTGPGTPFGWSSGLTNLTYTNWAPGQPFSQCAADDYVAILGPTNTYPGLWRTVGNTRLPCGQKPFMPIYGVVEVPNIPTNGVQFWVSGTNWTPGITNVLQGCLYANIVDTNYVSHQIFSAPGLLSTNVYQHVALTYNTNSGIAELFLNGTNVATTNFGAFVPKTDGDMLIGWDMSLYTNNFYGGEMDEMSVYGRAMSDAEIAAIYRVSALSTNRLIGKFDPTVTPAAGLAEALVSFGSSSNVIFGVNNQWLENSFTFTAASNSMPLTIAGIEPGILLDSFAITEAAETNLYYLPEQALASLAGDPAAGNWTLQVWDNRAGAFVTNVAQLVNWQLSMVLVSNAVVSASLPPQTPVTTTVPSGQIVYYAVTVPQWAHVATNILVSSSLPVTLFFNPTNLPTGLNPGDITLLTASTGGLPAGETAPVTVNTNAPFAPYQAGQTYYLGVQNNGAHSATVALEVDYDIVALTNGAPFTDVLTNEYSSVRYFEFDITNSSAYEATLQLLKLSGNADLVVSKGVPLPTLSGSIYGSFNVSNSDENIYVLTNSAPVPLSVGRWYLGVLNRGSGPVTYSVLAKELDTNAPPVMPVVIDLTNGVPFSWTAGPGAALTNFFHYAVTNMIVNGVTNLGLRFELFNLTGNGDLTVQTNALPLAPPFYQTSQNGGRNPEQILIYTNSMLTNLVADWYLGVPNREVTNINYSIIAVLQTNQYFPAFPDAQGAGRGSLGGRQGDVYHVTTTSDSGPGSLRAAVNTTTNNRTVVFDIGGNINLLTPLVITNSYLTIAGQTAPGGITVAGSLTTVQSAHDVIVRDVRFRSGTSDDSFQFLNVSNVIADHISVSWSASNLVSVLNSSNVTVQWSIMADSVYNVNSPAGIGSLLREGAGALSFHHNLYADNYSGSPRLGDNLTLDFVNNVIYNWGFRSGLTGGTNDLFDFSTNGCTNRLNYVCNYLIAGPDTAIYSTNNYNITNIAFFGGTTNALAANWIFQTNNFIDSDTNRVLNGSPTGWGMFTNQYTPFGWSFPVPAVAVDEAYIGYERVLDFAGVNLTQRDPVDTNIVTNVRYQTGRVVSSLPPTPAMVAWWKAENNYLDSAGPNNGTPENGTNLFAPGEVGQAFNFNGVNQYILVKATPSLNVGAGAGFTFEGWIYPTNLTQNLPIFEYESSLFSPSGSSVGVQFYASLPSGPGGMYFNVVDTSGNNWINNPINGVVTTNAWQHVAITYDKASGLVTIYHNGQVVGTPMNTGSITPQTSYANFLIGGRTFNGTAPNPSDKFAGRIDELTVYNYALSSNAIAAIYNSGTNGIIVAPAPYTPTYLDTDQDGIPDFWEITFGTDPFTPSNNNDRNGDGYTDLEEYNNWLAVPHALTITNTPVGVDLYQLCGESGHLAFGVTNSIHGVVYLTNILGSVTNVTYFSNRFAIFTPTNSISGGTNYYGYASFDLYVTNLDTAAYFGPVTVSVVVSAMPITTNPPVAIHELSSGIPYTNSCNSGGSDYYHIAVTTNDYAAVFELDNRTAPMSLVLRYGLPLPSLSSYDYYTNLPPWPATEQIVVFTNSTPVPLAAGDWYMAAVNVNPAIGACVSYSAKVTMLSNLLPPLFLFPTNTTVITNLETVPVRVSCVATDLDTPPLPLAFALMSGPTGLTVSNNGVINWTPTEAQGPSTNTIMVSVANGIYSVTNTFKIIVEESNLPPVLPVIPNQLVIVPGGSLAVTNTATDPDLPANPLTYTLTSSVPGANIPAIDPSTDVITWTPMVAQAGSNYLFTTVVMDTNPWAVNAKSLSATNSFYVTVLPIWNNGSTNTFDNGIIWFVIPVPTNAIAATNTLIFSTLPINVWFTTNLPPATTNATELLANRTNGVSILTTNLATAPTNIVPGGYYLLGFESTNAGPVFGAFEVDFAFAAPAPVLPTIPIQVITAGDTLVVTNTASDANTNAALIYYLTNSPAGVVIGTNGIITWVTTTNLGPTNVIITTVVTDTNANLSAANSFLVIVLPGLVDDQPQTNIVAPNSINWFTIKVPTNAVQATNFLLFATAPVNLWFSTNVPPAITNAADFELLTNSLGGSYVIGTNTVPRLVPGSRYFLGVQNTNSFIVTNAVKVKFHLVFASGSFSFFSIVPTNIAGSNGFRLTWFAPTNDQFHLQWTPALTPANWQNFNGVISLLAPHSPTNGLFQYFDDGSQTGGFGPTRFYRLLLLNSPTNTAPFFLNHPVLFYALPSVPFVYINAAKDWDVPPQTLAYSVTNTLIGTNLVTITANGVIAWTPAVAQLGQTNWVTTTVLDSGVPAKMATSTFAILVTTNIPAAPPFSSILASASGVTFRWTAPTNEQFQIRWTTNLVPISWHLFPDVITSPTTNFSFVDTNTPLLWLKFYQLILLP